ncbi:MAG TPA: fused MFS/spermidine synthase [Anaerolineales bacterium]|nr:fused MFS/spermidine synthase [Anaerolineales bacterium]
MNKPTLSYAYFAVFSAGFTTLGIELAAARLLGNVYGTSNLVWAGIIGLILLYLTVGYFLGGRWADRSPHWQTFYTIMAWGAFSVGLIPIIARPILLFAAKGVLAFNAPVAGGAFLATLILFIVPITLLGCVSPFAVRLLIQDVGSAGQVAGRTYAISTLGSLIGTFLPVMVLIPWLGTRLTYLSLAIYLFGVAWVGLFQHNRRRAIWLVGLLAILLGLVWVGAQGAIKPTRGLIYETESEYNLIQVAEVNETRYLLLNEGQGLHSVYSPHQLGTQGGTWDYFLTAPFFNMPPYAPSQVQSLAVVGLAAGTIPKQYSAVFGPIPMDGIEIDSEIVRVGQEYFAMNEPNLHVIIGDARWELPLLEKQYSVVGIDAYRLPYIPWQLTTVEFFQDVQAKLLPDGVLVINVGRTETDRSLIAAMYTTLREVFPSVYIMDVPYSFNSILVATVQPTQAQNLAANLALLPSDAHPLLREALALGVQTLQPAPAPSIVFTDDYAPVEQMTNAIVFNFLLNEGLKWMGQ